MSFDYRTQAHLRWVTPEEELPLHKEIVRIECTNEVFKRGFFNVKNNQWYNLDNQPIQVLTWYKIEPKYGFEHLVTTVFFSKHRKSPNEMD